MADLLDRLLTTLDVRFQAFAVCEVRPGWRLVFDPMDAVVIHYVLAGAGALQTDGGVAIPFGTHSIMIVPPGKRQSLSRPSGPLRDALAGENCSPAADGLVKFDAGTGEGEILVVCATINATYGGGFGLFDSLVEPIVENIASLDQVRDAFRIMLAENANPRIGTRALTEALMKQCMILLLRKHLDHQGPASPVFAVLKDPRLARAIAAIVAQPAAPFGLKELAEIAGMSRSSFAEHFSETFRQSPLDFLQKVRLRHAAHLLSATDLPVKVVAKSVGYASRSHFSRAFRDTYGVDPTAYRSGDTASEAPSRSGTRTPVAGLPSDG